MTKERTEDRLHDSRLVDRFLRNGTLDEKKHESFLKKLPDLEKETEALDVALESVGGLQV